MNGNQATVNGSSIDPTLDGDASGVSNTEAVVNGHLPTVNGNGPIVDDNKSMMNGHKSTVIENEPTADGHRPTKKRYMRAIGDHMFN